LISIGPHKAQVLSDLIKKEHPRVVVELGGYLGYSAILFADSLRDTDGSFHIWSIEKEPRFAAIAEKLIDLAGLSEHITVVVGAAEEVLNRLKDGSTVTQIDMLFLDHVEKLYKQDFINCRDLGLFREGSLIVADNVVRPGAPEYREFVRSDATLESEGVRGLIQPGDFEVSLLKFETRQWRIDLTTTRTNWK
jgi:catechol O-methyltransferase